MVWITHYIELLVDRITPKMVKLILNPTLVILISAPIALIVVGPLGTIIGNGLAVAINFFICKTWIYYRWYFGSNFPIYRYDRYASCFNANRTECNRNRRNR